MGKRSAVVELLVGNMGSMQWETRPSMQREDPPTMATKLEQIAVKARREPNLRFTSLAHHVTRERVLKNLQLIPRHSRRSVAKFTCCGRDVRMTIWVARTPHRSRHAVEAPFNGCSDHYDGALRSLGTRSSAFSSDRSGHTRRAPLSHRS